MVVSFPVEILKHVANIYTPKVFKLFEAKLCRSYDCNMEVCNEMGTLSKYKVTPHKKHYCYIVTYDASKETISCTCRKFEFAGMLCSHSLKVFSLRGITEVSKRYILKRWTKDAKKGSSRNIWVESATNIDPKATMRRRYRDFYHLSTHWLQEQQNMMKHIKLLKKVFLSCYKKSIQAH